MPKKSKPNDYDSDPVTYCSRCYSLNIKHDDAIDLDCCGECGCTDFKTSNVYDWEKLFNQRYGHKYIEKNHDVKKSAIFQLSIEKLKSKVFNNPSWREICKSLYSSFPGGLSRADSVILLFAKLVQDNRLDDLKMKLVDLSATISIEKD